MEKEEEALLLEDTLSQLKLNPVFEKKLLHLVTEYYCKKAVSKEEEERCAFLIQLDKDLLEPSMRRKDL